MHRHNMDVCKCIKSKIVHFWSLKREVFSKFTVKLPNGFGFYSGCHANIDGNKLILIGGHYTKTYINNEDEFLLRYPSNNQVIQLDLTSKKKWIELPKVPIPIVSTIPYIVIFLNQS